MIYQFAAPCLMGLEGLAADELRGMGAGNVRAENARVLFEGDESILSRANICSRFAERVQIMLGEFTAKTFDELFEGTKALTWENYIGRDGAFPVKGYSLNSKLFSVRDCQSIIKKAVASRLEAKYKTAWFEETGPVYQIRFSILKDRVSLFIDCSGDGLHKRGYRPQANPAPIKETLAAALASVSRLKNYHTLYDPFCGSGTILIEGAMLANNIAPGLNRGFAAERFGFVKQEVWRTERERAADLQIKDDEFTAFGSDIDETALELTKINAQRAGVKIQIEKRDIKDFEKKTGKGTVICNPPYGERMQSPLEAAELCRVMGRVFTPERGWSYCIISANEEFERLFGRPANKRRKLYNGMIKCQAYMYFN